MQINQNNTINGDSSNSKMLYVGCLVFYSFLLFLNVAQIVPIFREQWKTSGSTSSPWSRGCLLPCSRRKGAKNLLKLVDKYLRVNKSGFRRKQMQTKNLQKIMNYKCKLVIIIMELNICQFQKVLIQLNFEICQANFNESLRSWTF